MLGSDSSSPLQQGGGSRAGVVLLRWNCMMVKNRMKEGSCFFSATHFLIDKQQDFM